jgi:hypothetical protein
MRNIVSSGWAYSGKSSARSIISLAKVLIAWAVCSGVTASDGQAQTFPKRHAAETGRVLLIARFDLNLDIDEFRPGLGPPAEAERSTELVLFERAVDLDDPDIRRFGHEY